LDARERSKENLDGWKPESSLDLKEVIELEVDASILDTTPVPLLSAKAARGGCLGQTRVLAKFFDPGSDDCLRVREQVESETLVQWVRSLPMPDHRPRRRGGWPDLLLRPLRRAGGRA
jgi:hypothetical protein